MLKSNQLKWLAYLTCIGMMLVLLNGALVTKTDSGQGCGAEWPLCNGKFVPAYTIASMIEYSHRAVSGIVGILVVIMFIAVWKFVKERKDTWWYALIALVFTMVQAVMGALAVVWGQVPAVMALHYGFSLIAFAGTLMLSIALYRRSKGYQDRSLVGSERGVSVRFRYFTWIVMLYSYIVVYVGAFVRHTDAAGGCQGWPLCNGAIIPELYGTTLIAFIHRVAAMLLFILIATLAHVAFHHYKHLPEIRWLGVSALIACVAQIISGAWVVFTFHNETIGLFAGLLHTVLIACLFGLLCYLSVRVLQLGNR